MARRPGRGLRIIAGTHRGARLETPPGKVLRPMRDQVRGALFNSLAAAGALEDAAVLDLFAGSGSLGLEAISRGARRAVCVDKSPVSLGSLRANVAKLGEGARVTVVRHDLARGVDALARRGPFDLILVHPPFELLRRPPRGDEPDVTRLLNALATPGLLASGGRVAFETPNRCYREPERELPQLEVLLRREYGSTALFVARAGEPGEPTEGEGGAAPS